MIVCVCKRVSNHELNAAIEEGARSVQALSRATGCGTQCGRCVPTVRELLADQAAAAPLTAEINPLPVISSATQVPA
ncbi:MAG: (2Fe-2S)-binding protein [Wenzhouxiangellaceae bacterium]